MQLDLSVPKKKPVSSGEDGGGGLLLSTAREAIDRALCAHSGRILVLSDGASFSQFVPAARLEHTVCMLWDGNALGLFALPEVRHVLVSGGREALEAARFFAHVRRISCTAFPQHAALDGVFNARGAVCLDGHRLEVPLAEAQVVADTSLLANTLAEGYARLLLSRLALFEATALAKICCRERSGAVWEEAFLLTSDVRGELSEREVVLRNAALRRLENEGVPCGEGRVLAELSASRYPAATAYLSLCALYTAFFERGVPRRYAVPDYAVRSSRSGTRYAETHVPTPTQYASRAIYLERVRGELLVQMRHIRAAKQTQLAAMRALDEKFSADASLASLNCLPEHAPEGLSAVIRDFGLLD